MGNNQETVTLIPLTPLSQGQIDHLAAMAAVAAAEIFELPFGQQAGATDSVVTRLELEAAAMRLPPLDGSLGEALDD